MKHVIKAAFHSRIESLKHRRRELKNLHRKLIQVEQDLTEISTEDLIKLLQNLDSYFFEDNHINYTRFLTDKEIKKQTEDIKDGIDYDIYRLEKWCKLSEENKNQIKSYLKRNYIIVKELENI